MRLSIGSVLALLALPAVLIIPAFLLPKYALTAFGAPAAREAATWFDKLFYLSWSMTAMGLVTVLQWDALFPDRRDYAVLTPLPIRLRTVFAAKLSALLGFLAIFSLALASISPVLYPLIVMEAQPSSVTLGQTLRFIGAHTVAVLAASVFVFSFLVALEGVLMLLLGGRGFRRIARYVQLPAIFALLAMFLFFPTLSDFLYPKFRHPEWIAVFPPMWFLGIYEMLNGSVRPIFVPLAETGVRALGFSALAAAVAYTLSYARVYRRSSSRSKWPPAQAPSSAPWRAWPTASSCAAPPNAPASGSSSAPSCAAANTASTSSDTSAWALRWSWWAWSTFS